MRNSICANDIITLCRENLHTIAPAAKDYAIAELNAETCFCVNFEDKVVFVVASDNTRTMLYDRTYRAVAVAAIDKKDNSTYWAIHYICGDVILLKNTKNGFIVDTYGWENHILHCATSDRCIKDSWTDHWKWRSETWPEPHKKEWNKYTSMDINFRIEDHKFVF